MDYKLERLCSLLLCNIKPTCLLSVLSNCSDNAATRPFKPAITIYFEGLTISIRSVTEMLLIGRCKSRVANNMVRPSAACHHNIGNTGHPTSRALSGYVIRHKPSRLTRQEFWSHFGDGLMPICIPRVCFQQQIDPNLNFHSTRTTYALHTKKQVVANILSRFRVP